MKIVQIISVALILLNLLSCGNEQEHSSKLKKQGVCEEASIWRDHNGPDSCSVVDRGSSCKKILGTLKVISRLHRSSVDEGVYGGGISSRWYEIEENAITYHKPNGKVADSGYCNCKDGQLTVRWKNPARTEYYEIHFNSDRRVELRYLDYPFSFGSLSYDSTKAADNPTKVLGVME